MGINAFIFCTLYTFASFKPIIISIAELLMCRYIHTGTYDSIYVLKHEWFNYQKKKHIV
jgi:hypothetical protein